MNFEDYPRPHSNSGLGFHYFPDLDHTRRSDADIWIPRLVDMRVSWLVVPASPARPIPDAFLQRLMMADIEPVIILRPADGNGIGPVDVSVLRATVRSMADSGVHYVVLFDRPNDRSQWHAEEWSKPSLVERFVDILVPVLEAVAAEGMIPVLPPMEPYGAYWDTTFLQTMLASLKRRGLADTLSKAAIGIRNFANNRPLDWGQGGRQAWPQARPYTETVDGQDHRGFRLFEWYSSIAEDELGHQLPMVTCANGPQSSMLKGRPFDKELHASASASMARMMLDQDLPPIVLNHAFWLLAAERHQVDYLAAWFEADGTPRLPAVGKLYEIAQQAPARGQDTEIPALAPAKLPVQQELRAHSRRHSVKGADKPISHYLLLPTFEWGVTKWHLTIVQEYVQAFLPTCGFSVQEAKQAEKVTIIGNEQGVGTEAVMELEAAGCQVERVAGDSGKQTHQMLQEMARIKQRG